MRLTNDRAKFRETDEGSGVACVEREGFSSDSLHALAVLLAAKLAADQSGEEIGLQP